jgi:GTPase SAR1 family protein
MRGGSGVVGGRRRNEIVLIGPGNAGKTTMFLKVRFVVQALY